MPPPTMLTPETARIILEATRRGNFPEHSAALAGVHRTTLLGWLSKGEKAILEEDEGAEDNPYAAFATAYARAEAEAADDALGHVREAMSGKESRAHLKEDWFLERRFSRLYRQTQEVEHTGPALTIKVELPESATLAQMRAASGKD